MNLETKNRTEFFRKYMGPSSNGMKDSALRKLAGWTSFNAGWDACLESQRPIKREPLTKRTQSG